MYQEIINELNSFLNNINVPATPINPDVFQSVFIKKLSNQNITKDKRRINAGNTVSTVNQTHIDVTGRQSMLFFFETLNTETTSFENIDIDLFDNNLRYLDAINAAERRTDLDGNIYFVRSTIETPAYLVPSEITLYSAAYKKYGHTGEQVQINIPNAEEAFTQLQKYAFQDDALVLLRYNYIHYMALLIPFELCNTLYSITNTHENQNVNIAIENPSYDESSAHELQREIVSKEVMSDEVKAEILQRALMNNPTAGTDMKKFVKTRVSQGAFRRLLLLDSHQCCLCDITTTSVLRASHIKEWAESSREERMDPNNGLLLCANHDALFDRHLVSFDPNTGNICISSSLDEQQKEALNLCESSTIYLTDEMRPYMTEHYNKYLNRENP